MSAAPPTIGAVVLRVRDLEVMTAFWSAALGYAPCDPPEDDWVSLGPVEGTGVRLSLDRRASEYGLPPRFHLDLHAEDQAAEVARLIALGAREVPLEHHRPVDWRLLEDPEGNRFDVVQLPEEGESDRPIPQDPSRRIVGMRVLHIVTSPRTERSASVAVASAFVEALRAQHPDLEVDVLDVWQEDMPEFDQQVIEAKYKTVAGEPLDERETRAWDWITAAAARFERADRIVLGLPMWNWAYPYKFKQLVDLVSQRGLLFTFDGTEFGPAIDVERALIIATRGQGYRDPASPLAESVWNHQIDFPELFLRTIGVRDVRTLVVEHTWDDQRHASIEAARQQAAALAADF